MHECTLMNTLLVRAESECRSAGATRVLAIRLLVGDFSGVEPFSLRSAFELLAPGTIAEGARLEIDRVPLCAECEACSRQFRVEAFQFLCPECRSGRTRILSGDELVLESLTVAP